ncbi:MAG: AI-2E family transporter [Acidobacteria bacterium]|nr:AI-2E family transporter [Acidobacteriota bacterium]
MQDSSAAAGGPNPDAQGTDLGDVADTATDATSTPPRPAPIDIRSAALAVIAALLSLAALRLAAPVLIPLAFAILASYALNPVVTTLVGWRIQRPLAALLVLSVMTAGAGYLVYSMTDDVAAVAAKLPKAADRMRQTLRDLRRSGGATSPVQQVQQAAETLEAAAAEAAGESPVAARSRTRAANGPVLNLNAWLMTGSLSLVAVAAEAVVVLFLALYLLAAGDLFKRKLVRVVGTTLSEKKITVQILDEIDRQIATFLLVRLVITVLVAVFTWLPLWAIGLEQAALWGVAAGVLNIIPYLGPVIVAAVVFVVGFVQFGTVGMAAAASGITVVVTSLEGYLLTPWLTSRAAQMNAVAIFVGLLFWGWLWGLAGVLLAVPMMLALKAISDRVEELTWLAELLGE